jgi:hypothetical protein
MRVKLTSFAVAVVAVMALVGSTASAEVPSTASNMGVCSSYLAQLDVPGQGNIRAEVNHVIVQYGDVLGLTSPGDLYKVRARQHVNGPPAEECTPRQLPGGGQG